MAKTAVTEGVRSMLLLTERGESASDATERTKWSSDKRCQIVHGGRDFDRVVIPAETFLICSGGISLCSWRKGFGSSSENCVK
ncbi:hypothetical protein A2U01_0039086 [Trifolium medium]|uniref:Uncharacterized protein n=1 Tax=Trifolium medium TaxID=97028 RepID=A0A392Q3W1_9FABA|nr:hypothetical protein [Trifolium medium]